MSRKPGRKGRGILGWLGIVFRVLLLTAVAMCAFLLTFAIVYVKNDILPQVETAIAELTEETSSLTSSIYCYSDETGAYETLQTLYGEENRVWISYNDIPTDLLNAAVAIEDKRFYQHNGVDWIRTTASVITWVTGTSRQGGSTITQQLIKNLTQQTQVTVQRKVVEIFTALEFEKTHTKEEILELYLNEIYLGRNCYGVAAAASLYFDKSLEELTLAECASLVSITNNPSLYDPYTKPENNHKRAKLVLEQMCEQGYITESECDDAITELGFAADENGELQYDESLDQVGVSIYSESPIYSWYTDAVIDQVIQDLQDAYGYDSETASDLVYSGGLQIYTCMDPDVQAAVDAVYNDNATVDSYTSESGEQLQSAITVIDNATGAVVALSGGIGEKIGNRIWNRATDTVRQPGSALKPLSVYAPALEAGYITPDTVIKDRYFTKIDGQKWPKNSDGKYRGNVTVTYALSESLNTIAVKVLDMVGLQESFNFVTEKLHLSTIVDNYTDSSGNSYSDLGYAQLGLGGLTLGVSTYEMAAAYSVFPREGIYIEPYLYTAVLDSDGNALLTADGYTASVDATGKLSITGSHTGTAVLSTTTCTYITGMLEYAVENGTGTEAQISNMSVAGKTGTTTDNYDKWFCGYTPYYTAAVWTGYDQSSIMDTDDNPAAILWQEVMATIHADLDDPGF